MFSLGKTLLLLLLLVTNRFICLSQVTGKVIDQANSPIEYATATLYNQETNLLITGVITDINGVFSFENLKKGIYFIETSFIGYERKTIKNIRVASSNKSIDLGTIQLALGTSLNEVLIQGKRPIVINKIDRQIFDADKFKSAQGGSGVDFIRNLPSISINGQGEIYVRGSSGFVVLLNGKPLQGNASALMAQLPANTIESVEVITAPSAKYDPEGKAGILNIITQKGIIDLAFGQINLQGGFPSIETYGNFNVNQRYGLDAIYNVRNDKWNISLSSNYQRNDLGGKREGNVFTIIEDRKTLFPSSGERSFDEINFSSRFNLDFTPDSANEFSVGLFAGKRSKDRLADILYFDNHALSTSDSNKRLYTFQYFNHNLRKRKSDFALGSFDFSHKFKNNSKLSTSFLYEYTYLGGPTINQNLGFPDKSVLYQDEYNTNDNPLYGIRSQIDYTSKSYGLGVFEAGYQFSNLDHTGDFFYERRYDFNNNFELVPEFSSEVNLKRSIHAFYSQFEGERGKWDYITGIRIEIADRILELKDKANTIDETFKFGFTKLYPSASLQYRINDNTHLKAAYSKRVERTSTFKMNPFPEREHSETLEQGDPELKPEFADLAELSINKKTNRGNSVFVTGYYRRVQNVVNRVNTIYNDTILNRIYSNVGDAKAIGLELGAYLKPIENWSNFIGTNIYDYKIIGEFENRQFNTNAIVYSINLNSTYSFWEKASLQFTFNYLSERITAQGQDSRFYSPNITFQKTFLDNRLTINLQWQNIDLGILNSNEQKITTYSQNKFFTTTNYIYEVDMVLLNLSYTFKNGKNKSKFIESEFGKREF